MLVVDRCGDSFWLKFRDQFKLDKYIRNSGQVTDGIKTKTPIGTGKRSTERFWMQSNSWSRLRTRIKALFRWSHDQRVCRSRRVSPNSCPKPQHSTFNIPLLLIFLNLFTCTFVHLQFSIIYLFSFLCQPTEHI